MRFKHHLPWLFVSIIVSIAILLLPSPMTPVVLAAAQPSGWIELIDERTPVGKKYINLADGGISITTSLPTIHYESIVGSGVYDNEVDFTPRRVNNARLDGWIVTQSGWHYALGQPSDKSTDGWVGFGGRQGDHWVKFRLARVGYLHWPTRTWDDIGSTPTYDRANLVSVTSSSEYGHGNLVNVQTTATWANIWTTPSGGSLNISWKANGDGLKEDIIINQAAREWLAANRPPSTPVAETWFGFALEVDWSDVPKIMRAGLELSPNDDFSDDGEGIELRDALDRFLAFMPIGDVRVPSTDPLTPDNVQPLRKRFWLDGDGNNYVLVGIRADILNGMQAGDLIFDPTIDEQVGAGVDDTVRVEPDVEWWFNNHAGSSSGHRVGFGSYNTSYRFTSVEIPGGEENIDVAYIEVYITGSDDDGTGTKTRLLGEDIDDSTAPTSAASFDSKVMTSAFSDWNDQDLSIGWQESPSIVGVIEEITQRVGWASGNDLSIFWRDNNSDADKRYGAFWHYDGSAADALKLHVEYSLWSNSAPTITNKITSDSGEINAAYSRSFTATDADSNQTLIWEINATDAAFLSIESLNRTTYINGTLPSSEGTYYVNVTVGDQGPTNLTDYVNYTLNVVIAIENFWGSTEGVIFIIGLITLLIFIVLGIIISPAVWVMAGMDSFLLGFVAYDATLSVWIVPMFAFLGIALILGGALKTKEGL